MREDRAEAKKEAAVGRELEAEVMRGVAEEKGLEAGVVARIGDAMRTAIIMVIRGVKRDRRRRRLAQRIRRKSRRLRNISRR